MCFPLELALFSDAYRVESRLLPPGIVGYEEADRSAPHPTYSREKK
jgi:hypothetical protein